MAELKQCPFCGRIPTVEECGTNRWFVRCKCGIAQDKLYHQRCDAVRAWNRRKSVTDVPSAQPEQRYTEEELLEFRNGISISLLSKRSSQHWHYDEDTATEIEFLERLYEKVGADMRGKQDE